MIDIFCGDCLKLMQDIPDGSVDMILCDLPYGTTKLKWDIRIPFEPLWEQYNRVIKPNGAILLFGSQPFTTDLINSQRKLFRHVPTYNPQKLTGFNKNIGHKRKNSDYKKTPGNAFGRVSAKSAEEWQYTDDGTRYPRSVIKFSNWNGALFGKTDKAVKHPTTKPVPLLEYLIKTYTNEGDTVLDNCMGSGSTGVACVNTGRNFIGIEIDEGYYEIAKSRINESSVASQSKNYANI